MSGSLKALNCNTKVARKLSQPLASKLPDESNPEQHTPCCIVGCKQKGIGSVPVQDYQVLKSFELLCKDLPVGL